MSFWNRKPRETAELKEALSALDRLIIAFEGSVGSVTPKNCMKSPTVHAIVTAISRRIAVSPVHVYQTGTINGRETKQKIPDHPIAKLLKKPNQYQTRIDYWQDAASSFVREGAFIAFIGRGRTGPIRFLNPMSVSDTEVKQMDSGELIFKYDQKEYPFNRIHYARGPSTDFYSPRSPVKEVAKSIALEIAAEEFGWTFFNNGAIPMIVFQMAQGFNGFKTDAERDQFKEDFQAAFTGQERHKAMILPKGIEINKDSPKVENDKAQFIETRKYQRTVIAGAFNVPPHFVGDLERATFNNVEQQDQDFTSNAVMPIAMAFEAAMERDLLTDSDRNSGIIIRFNLDSILRADFQTRTEGLSKQIESGIITPNEARETQGYNPRDDEFGDKFRRPANIMIDEDQPNANDTSNNSATDQGAQ